MADLTVSINESGDVQGTTIKNSQTYTLGDIQGVYHAKYKILDTMHDSAGTTTCLWKDSSEDTSDWNTSVSNWTFGTGVGTPASLTSYIRITNCDTTQYCILAFATTGDAVYKRLTAGDSFVLIGSNTQGITDQFDSKVNLSSDPDEITDLGRLKYIGVAASNNPYIEIFVASKKEIG